MVVLVIGGGWRRVVRGWDLAVEVGAGSVTAAVSDHRGVELVEFGGGFSLPLPGYPAGTGSQEEYFGSVLVEVVSQAGRGRDSSLPDRLILIQGAAWLSDDLDTMRGAAAMVPGLPRPTFVFGPAVAVRYLVPDVRRGQYMGFLDMGAGSIDVLVLRRTRKGFEQAGSRRGVSPVMGMSPDDVLEQGVYELGVAISEAGLTPGRITEVLITGEASRHARAVELVSHLLETEPRVATAPRTATVLGALRSAAPTRAPRPDSLTARWRTRRGKATVLGAVFVVAVAAVVAVRLVTGQAPAAPADIAYIPDGLSVLPVNTETGVAGKPIPIPGGAAGLAVTPDGKTLYAVNSEAGTVTPVSTATDQPGTPIRVGSAPGDIAITPDGTTAYVTDEGASTVTPINLATNTAGKPIPVIGEPGLVAVAPNGQTVYVTSLSSGGSHVGSPTGIGFRIIPISTASDLAGTPIVLDANILGMVLTPDGSTLYAILSNYGATPGSVAAINAATGTVEATFPDTYDAAVTPDGRLAYLTDEADGGVLPVSTLTGVPAGKVISVGVAPVDIAISPDGKTAYVTGGDSGVLTPVDLATGSVGRSVTLGPTCGHQVVSPDGKALFIFCLSGMRIMLIATGRIMKLPVDNWSGDGMAFIP